jgi:hypothetical protein
MTKKTRKHTYIALTTHNAQMNGYNLVIAAGHSRKAVEAKAREIIGPVVTEYGTDIYKDTEHKNLIVVSKTRAKRDFGFDWEQFYPHPNDPTEQYEWVG